MFISTTPSLLFLKSCQSVLVLCRGLFTPVNDVIETKFQHHVYTAAFLPGGEGTDGGSGGGYSLADAFTEVGHIIPFSLDAVNDDLASWDTVGFVFRVSSFAEDEWSIVIAFFCSSLFGDDGDLVGCRRFLYPPMMVGG